MKNEECRASGVINGHEYVDLGLSVKWAICNVGAYSPEEYGSYFAWGEITTKEEYFVETYSLVNQGIDSIAGNPKYDAARANWGGTWRLPTKEEIDELVNNCQWTWTTLYGVKGFKVTGPNGNSIFLPAAGYWRNKRVVRAEMFGNYWCSETYDGITSSMAYFLAFHHQDEHFVGKSLFVIGKSYGQSVRAVTE